MYFEVVPDYNELKAIFESFTVATAFRYIASFSFFSVFIISIKGLARYSDAITSHYTVKVSTIAFNFLTLLKLSILAPIVARILEVVIKQDGINAPWKNIILDHPVKSAGVIIFGAVCILQPGTYFCQALAYWFVRIFTLTCCFNRKNRN